MPATYEPISTQTLGTAAASITFSSIPATYTDIRLVLTFTASATGSLVSARFNGDTANNYSDTELTGNGATTSSARDTTSPAIYLPASGSSSTTIPTLITVDVFSYAGSTNKTLLSTYSGDRNGSGQVSRVVGLWRSTAAITSMAVLLNSGNFSIGTTATLYGIKAA